MLKKIMLFSSLVVILLFIVFYSENDIEIKHSKVELESIDYNITKGAINFLGEEKIAGGFLFSFIGDAEDLIVYRDDTFEDGITEFIYGSNNKIEFYTINSFKKGFVLLEGYKNNNYNKNYNKKDDSSFDLLNNQNQFYVDIKHSYTGEKFRILNRIFTVKMPYIYVKNETILINYTVKEAEVGKYTTILDEINFRTLESKRIASKSYVVNKNGLYTGEAIVYTGGSRDDTYYQVLTLDNEYLDSAKKIAVYHYNRKNEEMKNIGKLEKIALHITGNEDCILISEYNYKKPIKNSGKIFTDNLKKEIMTIKEVYSGNDINNSRVINNRYILFSTSKYIHVYDLKTKKYAFEEYKINDDSIYSKVRINSSGFLISEKTMEGKTFIHRYIVNIDLLKNE
ncbi:MAG: hypothetical protein U9N10_06470 [Bacillota bacterium]|nr:hypothetical protein [Bacillota bacterium]